MAEGIVEEDTDEMLGPSGPPMSMQLPNVPTNLSVKDEESDCSETSSVTSPSPVATDLGTGCTDLSLGNNNCSRNAIQTRQDDIPNGEINKMASSSSSPNSANNKHGANTTSQHDYNGAMAGLVTLQNLQNLATLQQSLSANLTNMGNLQSVQQTASNNSNVNAPLNLSVNATSASPSRAQPSSTSCESSPNNSNNNNNNNNNNLLTSPHSTTSNVPSTLTQSNTASILQSSPPQPNPMPQFILASGQLVQGIQGAQLLIPTSQGVVTQTILTIPVNHINSTDQMVNLALNNGQVMQTSLANLQAMAQNNLLANNSNSQVPATNGSLPCQSLFNPTTLSHLLSSSNSAQQLLQSLPQLMSANHSNHTSPQATPLLSSLAQPILNQTSPLLSQAAPLLSQSSPLFSQTSPLLNQVTNSHNQCSTSPSPPPPLPPQPPSSSSAAAAAAALRMSGGIGNGHPHYGDIKSLSNYQSRNSTSPAAGMNGRSSTTGTSDISVATNLSSCGVQNMKRSPSSASPDCNNDSSTADLLIDSPNQPTINQANSNVVDGINLDEIKDFAKAFKLRRLSLGLTQTQVGQALSVTEGPAYSQSAICSALASQMVAAAQQQAMFEKLDITPKSAQKIKPVLERWMKEAEERYKSGQNHLTEFIGIEPSKKRKRRTSFTPQALELLNAHFERNTHPSGTEITGLAHQLGYEREVIRIWFCNKRQALKNTVRMMSKGVV